MRTIAKRIERRGRWRVRARVGALSVGVALMVGVPPSVGVEVEPPLATAERAAAVEIHSVALREAAPGAAVEVATSGSLVWTSYRDAEGRLVVELPDSRPSAAVTDLEGEGLISAVRVLSEEVADRPLTRLVVETRASAEHAVFAEDTTLRLELTPSEGRWEAPAVAEALPADASTAAVAAAEGAEETAGEWNTAEAAAEVVESETLALDVEETVAEVSPSVGVSAEAEAMVAEGESVVEALEAESAVVEEAVADAMAATEDFETDLYATEDEGDEIAEPAESAAEVEEAASAPSFPAYPAYDSGRDLTAVPATQLESVEVAQVDGETVVSILGDGEFYYSTFELEAPDRFVVDLIGVLNTASASRIPVAAALVEQVRVAQFKPQPELVARVVVDLAERAATDVARLPNGLRVRFAGPAPAEATTLVEDLSQRMSETYPGDVAYAAEEEVEGMGSVENATVGAHDLDAVATTQVDLPETTMPSESAAESTYEAESTTYEVVQPADNIYKAAEDGTAYDAGYDTGSYDDPDSYDDPGSAVEYAQVAQVEKEEPAAPLPAEAPSDVSLYGSTAREQTTDVGQGAQVFDSQSGEEKVYHGEPMTMRLKDADIKDVLRSFAQISGLNVVVQPGVTGSVTVELANVPWDQALEQILKINGLDYVLEGNIMRVAPITQLRSEAEEQQRLQAAKALSIPLRTVIHRVSYADAGQIAGLLKSGGGASIMSQRGSAVVDPRTNTLIIKELPDFMDTVIAVIENLDTPEPQVMIEARIIETTKRFSRSLGINWGFNGIADAAHGNTTDFTFPNNAEVDGGVQLLTGGNNGFLDVSLGNVLNTFRLDTMLQAAESDGLINILSAPRITTLNNQQASIQSGLQIPIQTVANNTVSVQFVNATLRLDVTPHVTAEGTVMMDINIQKREPQLAFAVVGATGAPISTKDARTRVIVRDGGTTVIGGLYEVSQDEGSDRVPGLANVPILKHLFKNKRRNDENEELLIFITPRVIKL